jgi:hypothetical protein
MYLPGKNSKPVLVFEFGSFITRGGTNFYNNYYYNLNLIIHIYNN